MITRADRGEARQDGFEAGCCLGVIASAVAFVIALILVVTLSGCGGRIEIVTPPEDEAECVDHDDCEDTEFCRGDWYGEPPSCEPRGDVGASCIDDEWCLDGLTCTDMNWCAASSTGELGEGPNTSKGAP
jgi:hypothetical protein